MTWVWREDHLFYWPTADGGVCLRTPIWKSNYFLPGDAHDAVKKYKYSAIFKLCDYAQETFGKVFGRSKPLMCIEEWQIPTAAMSFSFAALKLRDAFPCYLSFSEQGFCLMSDNQTEENWRPETSGETPKLILAFLKFTAE